MISKSCHTGSSRRRHAHYPNVAPRARDLPARVVARPAAVGRRQRFHEPGRALRLERCLRELFFCSTIGEHVRRHRRNRHAIARHCTPHIWLMWPTSSTQGFSRLCRNTPVSSRAMPEPPAIPPWVLCPNLPVERDSPESVALLHRHLLRPRRSNGRNPLPGNRDALKERVLAFTRSFPPVVRARSFRIRELSRRQRHQEEHTTHSWLQRECRNDKLARSASIPGKSCLYRFGSSVMRQSAYANACDPIMKSAGQRANVSDLRG